VKPNVGFELSVLDFTLLLLICFDYMIVEKDIKKPANRFFDKDFKKLNLF
jgi:hypothetical protein